VIVMAFAEDYRNVMAGGGPDRFDWMLFALGMILSLMSYGWALKSVKTREPAISGR
jgi:hypothetical protein